VEAGSRCGQGLWAGRGLSHKGEFRKPGEAWVKGPLSRLSSAQLDDNLKSVDVRLSPEEIRLLDEISSLEPEYPAWLNLMPSDRLPGEERRFDTVRA